MSGQRNHLDLNLCASVKCGYTAGQLCGSRLREVLCVDGVDPDQLTEFSQVKIGGDHPSEGRTRGFQNCCSVLDRLLGLFSDITACQLACSPIDNNLSADNHKSVALYGSAVSRLHGG